jgi:hypothetical protein
MKHVHSFLLSLVMWISLVLSCEAAERRPVTSWLYERPSEAELAALSSEEREEYIGQLRGVTDFKRRAAQRLLIELGDRETAENVVAECINETPRGRQSQDASAVLAFVRQAWVIPMLEPALLRDEVIEKRVWTMDSGPVPVSVDAAACIVQILNRCPVFSDEVRQWAQKMKWELDVRVLRQTMRDWWEQNKEHFAKGDYAAVQPLQPVSPAPPTPPPAPAVKAEAAPAATPQPAAKPSPPTATPALAERSTLPWSVLVGIAMLALAAGLVVILLRAKRRQP